MDTVLVVDDEPAIREIFTVYLEMNGYKSHAVTGGRECLLWLKTQKPDLILLDLMMEPMDGWETLLAIRQYPPSSQIPVIIITGKTPTAEDLVQYGGLIEDFIVKPVDFKMICESFHRIIENDRDLGREIDRVKNEGQDPEFLTEYIRLLRLTSVTNNLKKRLKDRQCSDQIPLKKLEERLQWLHEKLGFPDQVRSSSPLH
ncbi:response regulator [Methanoregula sp.]|jgi:CheY-like chemotaxis protein|uniref:response regulator n=1 Tax=Methanoregula sp. TaxID=2052170 RepID=UPI003563876D